MHCVVVNHCVSRCVMRTYYYNVLDCVVVCVVWLYSIVCDCHGVCCPILDCMAIHGCVVC